MNQTTRFFSLLFILMAATQTVSAICLDTYRLDANEITELESMIKNTEAPEPMRVDAYSKLSCSDSSVYRKHAEKLGLADPNAKLLRAHVLRDAVLKADMLFVELIDSPKLSTEARQYIRSWGEGIRLDINRALPDQACVTLFQNKTVCTAKPYIKVVSTSLNYQGKGLQGFFELQDDGTLEGYITAVNKQKLFTDQIPARIQLF